MAKEDEIKLIAYNIWEQENRPDGKDWEHWFRAEAILEVQMKQKPTLNSSETKLRASRTTKPKKPKAAKRKKKS